MRFNKLIYIKKLINKIIIWDCRILRNKILLQLVIFLILIKITKILIKTFKVKNFLAMDQTLMRNNNKNYKIIKKDYRIIKIIL